VQRHSQQPPLTYTPGQGGQRLPGGRPIGPTGLRATCGQGARCESDTRAGLTRRGADGKPDVVVDKSLQGGPIQPPLERSSRGEIDGPSTSRIRGQRSRACRKNHGDMSHTGRVRSLGDLGHADALRSAISSLPKGLRFSPDGKNYLYINESRRGQHPGRAISGES